jgi:glycosyl transferase family 25
MITPLPFWQQIDGIAVINLDRRTDRWQAVSAQAAQLPGRPEFTRLAACQGTALPGYGVWPWFRGRKTDLRWAARAGCVASHRRAMQHAREAGWNTMLVLEDDCDLAPLMTCNLDVLHRVLFIEHPAWDVCYLGHNEILPPAQRVAGLGVAGELWRVGGCATTHAYLVRRQARDWILAHTPGEESPWPWLSRHRAVDRWYGRKLSARFAVFALSPALLLQQSGYSDIGRHRVDWESMEMKSVVPVTSGFQRKLRQTHRRAWVVDVSDVLRGWWKRVRGF